MDRTLRLALALILAVLASLFATAAAAQDGRVIGPNSTPNPSALNQNVTISASINWEDVKATGTITYLSNGTPIPGCQDMPLENGSPPSCNVAFSAAGDYQITAAYSGDSRYPANTGGPITQHVDSSTQYYPRLAPQAGTLDKPTDGFADLAVYGGNQQATGTVSIYDGTLLRCTAPLTVPTGSPYPYAECHFPVSSGEHHLTMQYSGDANYRPGTATIDLGTGGNKYWPDFNNDGYEDQLVRGDDGTLNAWLMDFQPYTMDATWTIANGITPADVIKAADVNGDGLTDLVREMPDGSSLVYLNQGNNAWSAQPLRAAGTGWHIAYAADFDGDGKVDLLWRNDNGAVEMWLMDGATAKQAMVIMPPGAPWRIALIGDFNGDARYDLVWQNTMDHSVGLWLMDGTTVLERKTVLPAGTPWTPTQVADLDGDGMADLLWTNTDGSVGAWLMNGTTAVQHRTIMGPGTGWSHQQVGAKYRTNFLVWTHTNGSVGIWAMNGLDVSNRQSEMGPGTGWHLTEMAGGTGTSGLVWTHDNRSVGLWSMPYLTPSVRQTALPPGSPYTVISPDAWTRIAPL